MIPYGHQSVDETDVAAVAEVLRGDWLTTGPAVARFERQIAELSGVDSCAAVSSGTAALHSAYAAIGVGPGDEVITPPLTFVATQSTAMALGADVVFADVLPDTGLLDPLAVAQRITERTKAIVAVDYAGQPADMDALRSVADEAGAFLVEDAAHSIGASLNGRPVGSLADITTFSFFPTKNVTTGEGGAVVAGDPSLVERARRFANHGLIRDPEEQDWPEEGPWHQEVHDFGLNYRLPDITAALGSSQLARLDDFRRARQGVVDAYNLAFRDVAGLDVPIVATGAVPFWHLYPLRVPAQRRRELVVALRADGIGVQVNYLPAHLHPVFRRRGHAPGDYPVAESFYSREISLPLFVDMTPDDVSTVIAAVTRLVHGS